MKINKKILAASLAAALSVSAGLSLAACNKVENYDFEAESAEITLGQVSELDWAKVNADAATDPSVWQTCWTNPAYYHDVDAKVIIETKNEYTGTEAEGAETTNVGNFYGKGTLMTWKITSTAECEATLTLRAASSSPEMDQSFQVLAMNEVVFDEETQPVVLKVNDADITLSGTLPGLEEVDAADETASYYYNYATITATVKLVEGENVITLVAPADKGVINIDKMTISCKAKLSYTPVDNSDFPDTVM